MSRQLTSCMVHEVINKKEYAMQIWLYAIHPDIAGRFIEVEFIRKKWNDKYRILFYQYLTTGDLRRVNPRSFRESGRDKKLIKMQVEAFLKKRYNKED